MYLDVPYVLHGERNPGTSDPTWTQWLEDKFFASDWGRTPVVQLVLSYYTDMTTWA
jgi:hypothetical protein